VTKRKITMTVDEKVFAAFKNFCKKHAMKVSSKVELLMRETLENSDDKTGTGDNRNDKGGKDGAQ
jgi:hypothetical protein